MGTRVEEKAVTKLAKKPKKSKKQKTSDPAETSDCKNVALAGEESTKVDSQLDGNFHLAANGSSHVNIDGDFQEKKDKKKNMTKLGKKPKKTKKQKTSDPAETSDCKNVALAGEESTNVDSQLDVNFHLAANGSSHVNIDGDVQEKKDKKKNKGKKLDFGQHVTDRTAAIPMKEVVKESKKSKKLKTSEPEDVTFAGEESTKVDYELENNCDQPANGSIHVNIGGGGKKRVKSKTDSKGSDAEKKNKIQYGKADDGKVMKNDKRKKRKRIKDGKEDEGKAMKNDRRKKRKRGRSNDQEVLGTVNEDLVQGSPDLDSEIHDNLAVEETQNGETPPSNRGKGRESNSVDNSSQNSKSKATASKVRFSDEVEVFPLSNDPSPEEDGLVHGKRFSKEEDDMIKVAVDDYIKKHGLGEEGLKMVMNCRSHRELKNCWKEIGAAIPYRPYTAIYYRAHTIFERDESRIWTKEECEYIKKSQIEHGNDWKKMAIELGKNRVHVKDTYRRIKLANLKKGHWSQDEYQNLFDLVNLDLRCKASEEKKSKHGMLRDNICWSAISDKLSTRTNATCCRKWYQQLASPMVAEGKWSDADDYRLLDALFCLDACCIEDVDWDSLIDHRSGDVCRKRWDQMLLHIGQHGNKSFSEQVEVLAKRYCPDLVEAREAWDSKPVVP